MKTRFKFLALGALAATAMAGTALAAASDAHVLAVALPDGSVAHVQYHGDIAPQVRVVPVAQAAAPVMMVDPFAEMDRIMAAMQVRQAEMMRQVAAMQAAAAQAAAKAPNGTVAVAVSPDGKLPAGSYFTSVTTTSTGKGTCTQTVTWSSAGAGKEPQMTRASSGDCDSAVAKNPAPVPASAPVPPAAPAKVAKVPGTIDT